MPLAVDRPTRARYGVVVLTVLLGMVTYVDRACIATLAPNVSASLLLDDWQMSYAFSAFALAYAIFGVPVACWTEWVGTRKALAQIVVWWSVFTMATGAAWNDTSLRVIRFLFGAGEAGAWPAVARSFSRWIPYRERGTVQGIFFIGAHVAGGLTPVLAMWLSGFLSWRVIFVVFGLVGLLWATAWYWWFRDDPAEHPQVNAAELRHIGSENSLPVKQQDGRVPWARVLLSRDILALCLAYLPNSFALYFCITWFPAFLKEKHGLTGLLLALFSGLPLVLSAIPDVLGGLTTDWAVRRFGPRLGRTGVGFISNLLAGLGMLVAASSSEPWIAATLIAVAVASNMFILGAAWGTCQDIGGRHTGVVGGTMNTAGQIGSMICPIAVKWLAEKYQDWNAALILIGVVFLVGAACWCFVDPRRRIVEEG